MASMKNMKYGANIINIIMQIMNNGNININNTIVMSKISAISISASISISFGLWFIANRFVWFGSLISAA
jgi:hypothetical protein